ncbi:MAG: methyltransferase domain-containing protein [Planctomycetes bacterium]|nr:methyltransferase domain-containing protein [Planctomycetota bacterium]
MKNVTNIKNGEVTPAPLMQMVNGAWLAKTLTVAAELDIFTIIAESGPLGVEEIAEKVKIQSRPAEMLLNACVSLGLLEKEDKKYRNASVTDKFMVKGKPTYFGDIIIMLGTREYDTWSNLKEAVQANKPVSPDIVGLTATPESARQFTKAMHNNAIAPAIALSSLINFSRFTYLLDLGGGSGAYSIMITKKYPNLKAIVFDFPYVCEVAQEYIDKIRASSNVTTRSGNFWMDEFPEDADVVLLGQVLHSFSEKKNRILLQKIHDYLPKGGMLIITEFLLNQDKTGPVFATLFGLNMLTASQDGKTYTGKEIRQLLQGAGFVDIKSQVPLSGPHSVIYGIKQ